MSLWMHCSNRTTTSLLVSGGHFDICEGLRPQKNTSNSIYYVIFIGKKKGFWFWTRGDESFWCRTHPPLPSLRRPPSNPAHSCPALAWARRGSPRRGSARPPTGEKKKKNLSGGGGVVITEGRTYRHRVRAGRWEPIELFYENLLDRAASKLTGFIEAAARRRCGGRIVSKRPFSRWLDVHWSRKPAESRTKKKQSSAKTADAHYFSVIERLSWFFSKHK